MSVTACNPNPRPKGPDRLKVVFQGLMDGKSQRQIARDMGYDERTVRRDIAILNLPDVHLHAVLAGASPEQFLRAIRTGEAADAQAGRIQEELETGCHSDKVAQAALDYLLDKPLCRANEEMIADLVERRDWERRSWQRADLKSAPRRDPKRAFRSCERGPLPRYMPDQIEYLVRVILEALYKLAPESIIRLNAIAKIKKAVKNAKRRSASARPWGCSAYTVENRRV
jgi:hypothetical protein